MSSPLDLLPSTKPVVSVPLPEEAVGGSQPVATAANPKPSDPAMAKFFETISSDDTSNADVAQMELLAVGQKCRIIGDHTNAIRKRLYVGRTGTVRTVQPCSSKRNYGYSIHLDASPDDYYGVMIMDYVVHFPLEAVKPLDHGTTAQEGCTCKAFKRHSLNVSTQDRCDFCTSSSTSTSKSTSKTTSKTSSNPPPPSKGKKRKTPPQDTNLSDAVQPPAPAPVYDYDNGGTAQLCDLETGRIIVNCNKNFVDKHTLPESLRIKTPLCAIHLLDSTPESNKVPDEAKKHLAEATKLAVELASDRDVLIYCNNGRSRSPSIVAMFFIAFRGRKYKEVLDWFKSVYTEHRALTGSVVPNLPNLAKFELLLRHVQNMRESNQGELQVDIQSIFANDPELDTSSPEVFNKVISWFKKDWAAAPSIDMTTDDHASYLNRVEQNLTGLSEELSFPPWYGADKDKVAENRTTSQGRTTRSISNSTTTATPKSFIERNTETQVEVKNEKFKTHEEKLSYLKNLYSEKFGKAPRGRFASDLKWLQTQIEGAPNSRSGSDTGEDVEKNTDDEQGTDDEVEDIPTKNKNNLPRLDDFAPDTDDDTDDDIFVRAKLEQQIKLRNRKKGILKNLKKSTDFEKESDADWKQMLERHAREKEQFKTKRENKQKELTPKVIWEERLEQVKEELNVSSKELSRLLSVDRNGDGEMEI